MYIYIYMHRVRMIISALNLSRTNPKALKRCSKLFKGPPRLQKTDP